MEMMFQRMQNKNLTMLRFDHGETMTIEWKMLLVQMTI